MSYLVLIEPRMFCRQTHATRIIHRDFNPYPDDSSSVNVPIAEFASFAKFYDMHSWTIRAMCLATFHLMADGRGAERFRRTQHMFHFVAIPSSERGCNRPWNRWSLDEWSFPLVNEFIKQDTTFARMWESALSQCAEQIERDRATYGDRFIGELPVIFNVEGTHMSLLVLYPVVALHDPEALQDSKTRGAVDDLVNLCIGYTNFGIPMKPWNEDDAVAYPVQMVRMGESRRWGHVPLGTAEAPFHPDHLNIIFSNIGRKSELHPLELMVIFSQLW